MYTCRYMLQSIYINIIYSNDKDIILLVLKFWNVEK